MYIIQDSNIREIHKLKIESFPQPSLSTVYLQFTSVNFLPYIEILTVKKGSYSTQHSTAYIFHLIYHARLSMVVPVNLCHLNIHITKFIYMYTYIYIYKYNFAVCIYHDLFKYLPVDEHLSCFYLLAAAKNHK